MWSRRCCSSLDYSSSAASCDRARCLRRLSDRLLQYEKDGREGGHGIGPTTAATATSRKRTRRTCADERQLSSSTHRRRGEYFETWPRGGRPDSRPADVNTCCLHETAQSHISASSSRSQHGCVKARAGRCAARTVRAVGGSVLVSVDGCYPPEETSVTASPQTSRARSSRGCP